MQKDGIGTLRLPVEVCWFETVDRRIRTAMPGKNVNMVLVLYFICPSSQISGILYMPCFSRHFWGFTELIWLMAYGENGGF